MLMNSKDSEAKLYFGPSTFRVIRAGKFVRCAVSGREIPLEDLRYWSADHQEAYATAQIATKRLLDDI